MSEENVAYVLTRGSRPEAVLISYKEFLRFQALQERDVMARFDRLVARMAEQNAAADEREVAADILRGQAVLPQEHMVACRDPRDDKFLEVAVSGKADVLVTGDEDLPVLHPFAGIPILPPAAFLRMLDAGKR